MKAGHVQCHRDGSNQRFLGESKKTGFIQLLGTLDPMVHKSDKVLALLELAF